MTGTFEVRELAIALGSLFGGLVVGILVARLLRARLTSATMTAWGGDDVLVAAFRDVALVGFTAAGAYGAIVVTDLTPRVEEVVVRALVGILIAAFTFIAARVTADLVKLYALRSGGGVRAGSIFMTIGRLTIFAVGFLILLQTFGISITPLLTALGLGGLAVALALQDTLANLFAGIHLIASRKIRLGDYVKLDTPHEGFVTDINWRNTTIRQLPNNLIIVPNLKMAQAIVVNYHRPESEMSVLVDVGVSYDSDLEQVERATIEVAQDVLSTVPGGVSSFEPFIRYHTFNDSSIDFTVILRAAEYTDQYLLKHEFVKRLHRRYNDEGITIPFPIRTVHMNDGRAAARTAPGRAPGRSPRAKR